MTLWVCEAFRSVEENTGSGFVMKLRLMRSRSTGVETKEASLGVVEATLLLSDSDVENVRKSLLGS